MSDLGPALGARARRTYSAALSGSLDDVTELLGLLTELSPSAEARAWHAALSAAAWALSPQSFDKPALGAIAELVQAPVAVREVAALALTHLERACAVGFESKELERLVTLHERLLGAGEVGSDHMLWLEAAHIWRGLASAQTGDLYERTQALEKRALAARVAPLVIDASVQRALLAALNGDVESSTEVARRASRMARTEALPQQEYLAHLTLARARRLSRHPHLAIRILTALEGISIPQIEGWLAWELLMAGGLELGGSLLSRCSFRNRAVEAASALSALVQAAVAGERSVFERQAATLRGHVAGFALVEQEARLVVGALDYRESPAEPLRKWCNGDIPLPPPELQGLCVRTDPAAADSSDESSDSSEAYVLTRPDAAPRRVLGIGAPLVDLSGVVRLRRTRRRQGRVEGVAAILAAAGSEGLEFVETFERAYELGYEAEVHRGVFEVLLHRLRAYLGEAAELEREGTRVRLRPRNALLVPDPRCARPVHDRLLRVLAREGRATASDAAHKVGLSLRAVQDALKTLIEEGVCVSEREGRHVVYLVEDTTFSEPTNRLAFIRRASD